MERIEKQKHEKLQLILNKTSDKRTNEDLVELAKMLMQVNFLKQFSTNPDFIEMCRYLSLEIYSEKQVIFNQGDEGDNFYIILKGRVGVYVPKSLNKYRNFNYLKEIALIEAGQSFGELALLYNSVRSATIIALEQTELIVLNRTTFKKYIHNVQAFQLNQIINFYEHLIMFKDMRKNELISLSSKSIIKKYQSRIYLIKQNEEANCIFFIKSGLVQITRQVKFKINAELERNYDEPTEEEINKSKFNLIDLKICELSKGQYFGDYEVINRKKMRFSLFTLLPTTVIILSEYDFKLQISQMNMQLWLKSMKLYPNDVEIRKRYLETQFWNQYRNALMKNYKTEINFNKSVSNERCSIILKKNATLKTVYEPEEEITMQTLEKDIERQTNFNNLGYNPEKKHNTMGENMKKDEDWIANSKLSNLNKNLKGIHNKGIHNQSLCTTKSFSRYSKYITNNLSDPSFFEQSDSKEKQKKKLGKLHEIAHLEKMGVGRKGSRILPKIKNSSMSKIHNFVHAI